MIKTPSILLAAALTAGPVLAAGSADAAPAGKGGTYWWLHPKLGMVKVDKATHAMLTGKRANSESIRGAPSQSPDR